MRYDIRSGGFTLIELVVVIAILAIIGMLASINVTRSVTLTLNAEQVKLMYFLSMHRPPAGSEYMGGVEVTADNAGLTVTGNCAFSLSHCHYVPDDKIILQSNVSFFAWTGYDTVSGCPQGVCTFTLRDSDNLSNEKHICLSAAGGVFSC